MVKYTANISEKGDVQMKIFKKFLPVIVLTVVAFVMFAGCNENGEPPTPAGDVVSIGTGSTVFRFEMVDEDNNLFAWDVHTDEVSVGMALFHLGLIDGEQHSWGLMVTMVNGIVADFNDGGAWWRFDIDGQMALEGIGDTLIEDGVTYSLVFNRG